MTPWLGRSRPGRLAAPRVAAHSCGSLLFSRRRRQARTSSQPGLGAQDEPDAQPAPAPTLEVVFHEPAEVAPIHQGQLVQHEPSPLEAAPRIPAGLPENAMNGLSEIDFLLAQGDGRETRGD